MPIMHIAIIWSAIRAGPKRNPRGGAWWPLAREGRHPIWSSARSKCSNLRASASAVRAQRPAMQDTRKHFFDAPLRWGESWHKYRIMLCYLFSNPL